MIPFGAGDVYIVPPAGSSDLTPRKVGEMQEIGFDISADLIEVYGSGRFPLATAAGRTKISGKAKQAKMQGGLIAALMGSAAARTTGTKQGAKETMGASATTFTAAVVTGFEDRGVVDANNIPLKKVASAPAAGEYSVTGAGVYTFGTAGVYTVSSEHSIAASGESVLITNSTIGLAPTFMVGMYNTNPDGSKFGIKAFAATFTKLGLAFKTTEFTMPDLEFSCSQDAAGNVLGLYFPTAE